MSEKKMEKLDLKPTVGAKIIAEYYMNGKRVRKMPEIGVVTRVEDFVFYSKGEDGQEYKRRLTFNAKKGIRLIGFVPVKKTKGKEKEEKKEIKED